MKIIYDFKEDSETPERPIKLESFADSHGLVMHIGRRNGFPPECSYYASFRDIEVKDGGFLISTYGDGSTPQQAIRNYAKELSERTLIRDSMGTNRAVIKAPVLV